MNTAYVVKGTLKEGRTITLDEPLSLPGARVRITVELDPDVQLPTMTMEEAVSLLRERQRARGHVPIPSAEIDALMGWSNEDDEE